MKLLALASFFILIQTNFLHSQNFTFSPSDTHSATLEMDVYSEHQINVFHDLSDSAFISWRVIEEEYPAEWDVQLCDWQHCYTYLPVTGNMLGVPEGGSGYIRLLINPMNVSGNGHIMLWIYPTGMMDDHVEIHFNFNTVIANVNGGQPIETCNLFVDEKSKSLVITNAPVGEMTICSVTGAEIKRTLIFDSNAVEDVSIFSQGIYIAVTSDGRSHSFFVQ